MQINQNLLPHFRGKNTQGTRLTRGTAIAESHTCSQRHAVRLIAAHISRTNFTAETIGCCWDSKRQPPTIEDLRNLNGSSFHCCILFKRCLIFLKPRRSFVFILCVSVEHEPCDYTTGTKSLKLCGLRN